MKFETRNKSVEEKLQICQKMWEKAIQWMLKNKKLPYFHIAHWDRGSVGAVIFGPRVIDNFLDVGAYEFLIKLFVFDDRTFSIEFDEKEGRIIVDFEWDEPDLGEDMEI